MQKEAGKRALASALKLTEGISFSYLGLAFNKVWVVLAFPSFAQALHALSGTAPLLPPQTFYDLFFIVTAFAIAFVSLKASPHALRHAVLPVSAVASCASSLLLLAAPWAGALGQGVLAASIALGGVGVMGMAALWADFYATFRPIRAALLGAGAVLVMSLVCYATADSVLPRTGVLMLACAALSCFCYVISCRKASGDMTRDALKPCKVVFPWKAAAFIGAYSFAYGLSETMASGTELQPLLRALPALVIVAIALLDARHFNIKVLYNIAFPLMICGLLLVAVVPGVPAGASPALLEISYSTMSIMVMLIACSIAYGLGTSASFLFCILVAVQFVTRGAGSILRGWAATLPGADSLAPALTVLAVVLIVVASIAMLSEKTIFSHWGAVRIDQDDPLALPADVQLRMENLSAASGLTQREQEVLRLMALGRTNSQIAAEMYVAQGTAKAHIQHIYQKLDVHTRKELLGLLGAEPAAGAKKEK